MKPDIRPRRAPNGVVTEKPIPIRLLPEERAKVERLALREQRTLSATCRLLVRRGMADWEQTKTPLVAE